MKKILMIILLFILTSSCSNAKEINITEDNALKDKKYEIAVFAGGCFWCMEPPFEKLDGVYLVISGYTGGHKKYPTYSETNTGRTGHTEAVKVYYNPQKVTYQKLLDIFWRQFDPTDSGGSFYDRGSQYRSGIFYATKNQRKLAEESKKKLDKSGRFKKPIVTEITELKEFYRAEEYHQDYYKKNPIRYKIYRNGSGRDKFINKYWGTEK